MVKIDSLVEAAPGGHSRNCTFSHLCNRTSLAVEAPWTDDYEERLSDRQGDRITMIFKDQGLQTHWLREEATGLLAERTGMEEAVKIIPSAINQ